jgi:GntR family transcriptional regulator of arabinose operon
MPAQGLGRLSEQVLVTLRRELESGRWAEGAKLPTEKELCSRFNTSRNTVRRALSRLAIDGWIEIQQGAGAFVRRTGPVQHSRTISVMFPFDGESLRVMQQALLERGYLLSVFTHHSWAPKVEEMFLQRVLDDRHRALLAFCTPRAPRNDELLRQLVQSGVRVVHVEHYRTELPEQDFVMPDYHRGGYLAATSLMIAGYRDLQFLSLEGDGPFADILYEGFLSAVRDHCPNLDPGNRRQHLPVAMQFSEQGRRRLRDFVASLKPGTGLVLRSPDMSGYLLPALREQGLRVPEDVGLIGVRHLLGIQKLGDVDLVDYDWVGLLNRAIDVAVDSSSRRVIRELIAPTLVRRGTVGTVDVPSQAKQ